MGGAHRFVAADVDQLAGHRSSSVVHVSEQFVGGLPVGAHRHLADAGVVVQRRGDAVAAQLGVGAQGGRRVPRGVELGDDLDEPVGGVADDPGVVRRRVEAAGPALDVVRGAHLGEQRPRRHHQPPALVVAQVEVEVVDLVQRDEVDVAEHRLDREEVPGDVEHRAAVGEAGPVGDVDPGHGPRPGTPAGGLGGRRQHQAQGGQTAEDPLGRRRGDDDPAGVDVQGVVLGAHATAVVEVDHDVAVGRRLSGDGEGEAGGDAQPRREVGDDDRHVGPIVGHDEAGVGSEPERLAGPCRECSRHRHDRGEDRVRCGRGRRLRGRRAHGAHGGSQNPQHRQRAPAAVCVRKCDRDGRSS